ncbi:HpcH/HpaI aldolase/citrate lyase family protein [Ramlibacter sp.]|uniref:HpcH/HpaI aldolase/citrate lyase family protein n=1 Tax=Ramlibacter sp. TaxID=1917967 RepID=UPI003D0E3031
MTQEQMPRRCMLLVPGSNRKMIDKAATSDADLLMIDFDDAVVYLDESKKGAQRNLVQAMSEVDFKGKEVVVRINAVDMPWWQDDIRACVEAGIRTIMPVKADTPKQLQQVTNFLDTLPGADDIKLWPMMETVGAIVNCERIAQEVPRMMGMCFGIGDYTVSVGGVFLDEPDRVAYPLGKVVCVARYHGLVPFAPAVAFTDMGDHAIIERWGRYLKRVGYDGALVIHPKHVAVVNGIFSPSRAEIDAALEMREAIAQAAGSNMAALIIGGKLIEKVNIDIAKRTLAVAAKLGLIEGQGA